VINNYSNSINPEKNFFNSIIEQQKEVIINDISLHPYSTILKQESGSIGYESFASLPLKYKKEIVGTLSIYSAKKNYFNGAELKFIKEVSNDISIGIRSIRYEKELEKNYINTKRVLYETINSIALISERRDPYTAGHQKRVATLTRAIAKELKLDERRSEGIYFISILHDIGKMSIPLSILSKPACLSKAEIMLIQSHSREGYDMLKNIEFPWPVAQTILQHHERLDGSGYPYGLKENEISLESRIIAVADIIEAMSSHRPYRPAIGLNKALKELEKNSGILYDSKIVSICTDLFRNKRFKF
jgi:putative nucleotidyltransferase with HDIG domain